MRERSISPSMKFYKKFNCTILKRETCCSLHISGLVCIPSLFPPLLLHPSYLPTGQPAGFVTFLITPFTVYLSPPTTLSTAFTPVGLVCIPTSSPQPSNVTTSWPCPHLPQSPSPLILIDPFPSSLPLLSLQESLLFMLLMLPLLSVAFLS